MGKFSDWFNNNHAQTQLQPTDEYEYYEDTHNEKGEYTQKLQQFQNNRNNNFSFATPKHEESVVNFSSKNLKKGQSCQNVMVYEPQNADDVQTLIDFLKGKEPAIINLDDVDDEISQRVLDFVSGAVYALSGSVHRIASNIFLLSPEGVEITIPYDDKENK